MWTIKGEESRKVSPVKVLFLTRISGRVFFLGKIGCGNRGGGSGGDHRREFPIRGPVDKLRKEFFIRRGHIPLSGNGSGKASVFTSKSPPFPSAPRRRAAGRAEPTWGPCPVLV